MKNTNNKGFTMVEGLLIILILAVVSFAGYYIWHTQHKSSQNINLKSSQNTSAIDKKSSTTPNSNQKYLDIKELGVKFALSDKISDAYYIKGSNGYYYFSVRSFDRDSDTSGCSANETGGNTASGLVALIVAKLGQPGADPANDPWTMEIIQGSNLKQVGDAYYGFQKGNGPCWNPEAANADSTAAKVGDVIDAFQEATSTFTKD